MKPNDERTANVTSSTDNELLKLAANILSFLLQDNEFKKNTFKLTLSNDDRMQSDQGAAT